MVNSIRLQQVDLNNLQLLHPRFRQVHHLRPRVQLGVHSILATLDILPTVQLTLQVPQVHNTQLRTLNTQDMVTVHR